MHRILCASALLFISAPANSQDESSPGPPAAAGAPNQQAPTVAQSLVFDGNTPLEKIVADPVAKSALEKKLPGVTTHPAYEQVKAMSLRQLLPHAQPVITEEKIAAFEEELKPSQ